METALNDEIHFVIDNYNIQNIYEVGFESEDALRLAVESGVSSVVSVASLASKSPTHCWHVESDSRVTFLSGEDRLRRLYESILQDESGQVKGIELLLVSDQVNFTLASPLVKFNCFALAKADIVFSESIWSMIHQSNAFVLLQKKHPLKHVGKDTFVVTTPTYDRRPRMETKPYLDRCVRTVQSQSYKDYVHLIVGDHYADEQEFNSLPRSSQLYTFNLPFAMEREIINFSDPHELWHNGGLNTINYGLWMVSQTPGIVARLDDDDQWSPDHLQLLKNEYDNHGEKCAFVFSNAWSWLDTQYPSCGQLYHSSVSWRPHLIPLKYKSQAGEPADGVMWNRITEYLTNSEPNLTSVRIRRDTIVYDNHNVNRVWNK